MKVLLINGSPNHDGCTFTALTEVAKELRNAGIETEFFQLGNRAVHGCIACGKCMEINRCVFNDDHANECAEKLLAADGVVVGSPVYYAGPNGALCAMLDRVFFSRRGAFALKPGAAIVSARRGGTTAAFDRLNKYFTISGMPVVSSQYWNMVHGNTPDEVRQDLEGLQIMRTLGRNMAWLLQSIEKAALPRPAKEEPQRTNFIR